MPKGSRRSRTLRRIHVRTPGGKTVMHYRQRKNARAQCGKCGAYLHGMPTGTKTQLRQLTKSQKRPTRPFGGNLCTKCTRALITSRVIP